MGRDVRLHGVQRLGRGRERAVLGDGDEGCELAEVHRRQCVTLIAQSDGILGDNCWTDRVTQRHTDTSQDRSGPSPPSDPPRCEPIEAVPPPQGSRLRGPANPPSRPFPVFRAPYPAVGGVSKVRTSGPDRSVLRPRPHAARRRQRAGHHRGAPRGRGDRRAATIPGEGLLYRVFNRMGETLPSMALARQAAQRWPRAGAQTLVRRSRRSRPPRCCSTSCSRCARALIDEHRTPTAACSCWPRRRRTTW